MWPTLDGAHYVWDTLMCTIDVGHIECVCELTDTVDRTHRCAPSSVSVSPTLDGAHIHLQVCERHRVCIALDDLILMAHSIVFQGHLREQSIRQITPSSISNCIPLGESKVQCWQILRLSVDSRHASHNLKCTFSVKIGCYIIFGVERKVLDFCVKTETACWCSM